MKLAKFFLGKKKKATQPPFRWQQDWWLNIISYLEIDKIRSKGQGGVGVPDKAKVFRHRDC